MSTTSKPRFDVYEAVTNRIVEVLESGAADYQRPWIRKGGCTGRPINVVSGNAYNGINVVSLWVEALAREFETPIWGTFKQWRDRGTPVRKGEKASLIVFYKTIETERDDTSGDDSPELRHFARASWVFNAAQVEGYEPPQSEPIPDDPLFDPIPVAEAFVTSTRANITETGDQAYFSPSEDRICMPPRNLFTGTQTMAADEAYYATLCHELTHWSGATHRLNRDLTGRFGSESYAMEELIAELGAAFICADLGLTPEAREDHAGYIASWLKVLKEDKRAIFTASAKASEAANWLLSHREAA